MKRDILTYILSLIVLCMLSACNSVQVKSPSTKGGFETGQYRNVFVEVGYSPTEVDAKVKEVFNDVFRGPNKCYFEVGDSMGYVSDVKNFDVRTEGMSYGMMIAVQFGEKDIFDRLWRWSKKYMQHQDGPREGYFAWSCKTDGSTNSRGSASDGELSFFTIFRHRAIENTLSLGLIIDTSVVTPQIGSKEQGGNKVELTITG